jgi:hypothetical protein
METDITMIDELEIQVHFSGVITILSADSGKLHSELERIIKIYSI